jgi:hypothetical protein
MKMSLWRILSKTKRFFRGLRRMLKDYSELLEGKKEILP